MAKLTPKQEAFADYYIESGSATSAALKAGYSKKYAGQNADKLLKNTKVSGYIDERMKEIADKRIMGAQEALETLTLIARGEMEEEVILSSPTGVERATKSADINQRQKAIDSLLKRHPINKHDELKNLLLETQIEKAKAEIEQIKNEDDNSDSDDWVKAIQKVAEKRRASNEAL